MFDLPVDDKAARKAYSYFHKALIREGFTMLQFSVYARFHASEEAAATKKRRLRALIPPRGQVRFLAVSDRQFGKMEIHAGKNWEKPEEPPEQLTFF